jgi:hypothetical protein
MKYAKSADVEFLQFVENPKLRGFVHSTFNRTFNFQCLETGELYTIACSKLDNGPNTLILDMESFETLNIKVNDRVRVEDNNLFIADKLVVSTKSTAKWKCLLPDYPKNLDLLRQNLAKMKNYIDIYGKGGGIKKDLQSNSPFEAEMSKMLEKRTNLLFKELVNLRMTNALKHAISLIGLGPGLTPSGDDFLVGLFTIFHLKNSPFYEQQSFCEEVLIKAKPLTNDISYTALKKAANGKVRESIICLIASLIGGNEEDINLSLNKVLNIGSSSGTDIALGIVCGLEANLRSGGKV